MTLITLQPIPVYGFKRSRSIKLIHASVGLHINTLRLFVGHSVLINENIVCQSLRPVRSFCKNLLVYLLL